MKLCLNLIKNKLFLAAASTVIACACGAGYLVKYLRYMQQEQAHISAKAQALETQLAHALADAAKVQAATAAGSADAPAKQAAQTTAEIERLQRELSEARSQLQPQTQPLQQVTSSSVAPIAAYAGKDDSGTTDQSDDQTNSFFKKFPFADANNNGGAGDYASGGAGDPDQELREQVAFAQALDDAIRNENAAMQPSNQLAQLPGASDDKDKGKRQENNDEKKDKNRKDKDSPRYLINDSDDGGSSSSFADRLADRQSVSEALKKGTKKLKEEFLSQQDKNLMQQMRVEMDRQIHDQLFQAIRAGTGATA